MTNIKNLNKKKNEIKVRPRINQDKEEFKMNNINKQCMEKILTHLTKLISFNELEDVKNLEKLVNMATCVSAQLNVIDNDCNGEIE